MNHLVLSALLCTGSALALDHHFDQQRKIKCTIKDQRDVQTLHAMRQSSLVDLWDEDIDQLPTPVTMRVHLSLLSSVQAAFECAQPEPISVPVEKNVPLLKTIKPQDFFNDYRSHDQIMAFISELGKRNPNRVLKVESMGKSGEGREMPVVTLGKPSPIKKSNLWVNGGQHAREWIAIASCLYVMDKIIRANDATLERLLDKYNIVVAPLINPDGYEYSRIRNRFWRKNRTPNKSGHYGTDLNRNWGAEWGVIGTSTDPASDIYCGTSAESEPEVRNMAKYVLALADRVAGLDVHSYGQKILRNYGYTRADTKDEERVRPIGEHMAALASKKHHKAYASEKSAALYPTGGGLDDWFYVKAGMLGFTIELRDDGTYGFLLPAAQIRQTGDELVEVVKALLLRL